MQGCLLQTTLIKRRGGCISSYQKEGAKQNENNTQVSGLARDRARNITSNGLWLLADTDLLAIRRDSIPEPHHSRRAGSAGNMDRAGQDR